MEFDTIDSTLTENTIANAQDIFHRLYCELAVRVDNYHVGSGRGGNQIQLFVLSWWKHHLSNSSVEIELKDGKVVWGINFIKSEISNIREKLDSYFPTIALQSRGARQTMQMNQACLMCHNLAMELDRGDTSNLTVVGTFLKDLPLEIILLSVRTEIGISRLVKFNIDEYPSWEFMLQKINKIVD